MNIQKGKTLAWDFSLHPLSLARWATPPSSPLSSHLCRVYQTEGKHLGELQALVSQKNGIYPSTPLLSLFLILRLIDETDSFRCGKDTLLQAWRTVTPVSCAAFEGHEQTKIVRKCASRWGQTHHHSSIVLAPPQKRNPNLIKPPNLNAHI